MNRMVSCGLLLLVVGLCFLSGYAASLTRAQDAAAPTAPQAAAQQWGFDKDATGTLPEGWEADESKGVGKPGKWNVSADGKAPSAPNVLQLVTSNSGSTYNLCVLRKLGCADVDLSVKVRADTGKEDQGGGLVWRFQDHDNYYVARFNPLESNFRVYRVVGGKRVQLATASASASVGEWVSLRVEHVGDKIACYLNGAKLLSATDDAITKAGSIGLWTKADASSSFDDLSLSCGR